MRYYKKLTMMTFLLFSGFCLENVAAQRGAIRNNLLYDATLTPNLGVDFRVDSLWTIGGLVGVNAWDIDKSANKKWRHLLVSANARRYLGDSLYHKSYVEGNLIYSHFNVGSDFTMPSRIVVFRVTSLPWVPNMAIHGFWPVTGASTPRRVLLWAMLGSRNMSVPRVDSSSATTVVSSSCPS